VENTQLDESSNQKRYVYAISGVLRCCLGIFKIMKSIVAPSHSNCIISTGLGQTDSKNMKNRYYIKVIFVVIISPQTKLAEDQSAFSNIYY